MKALLFPIGVLALAMAWTMAVPAREDADVVTADDVRLASEQTSSHGGPQAQDKGRHNGYRSAVIRSFGRE